MYPIEKNVAIPTIERPNRKTGAYKYPFAKMEVGDSFFVPINREKEMKSVASSCSLYGKKFSRRFTARTVHGGVRVWRIE